MATAHGDQPQDNQAMTMPTIVMNINDGGYDSSNDNNSEQYF
jgi:hypothetical protein